MVGEVAKVGNDRRAVDPEVEALIERIATMKLDELRMEWRQRRGTEPPVKKSADMLRRLLAWHIQEEAYGGLSAATRRRLWSLEQALTRNPDHQPFVSPHLSAGTALVREWKGVSHRVEVLSKGFAYGGKTYGSLSEIARVITGARWSGPAFFGLRKKTASKEDDEQD